LKEAVLAGGCFWCTEAVFINLKGVNNVVSGYIGGDITNPTYEMVCSGKSGHLEAIKIDFDPSIISYTTLLEVFFITHDPTQINGQGNDIGTQYLSAVFFYDEQQKKEANDYMEKLSQNYELPIVTKLYSMNKFYPAEDYHQNYYNLNKTQPYCEIVINPKMSKFRENYKHLLKTNS
tara:strand:+ start:76 stop:606 length:531 start_codon:yes stop_codon:yes gene_type:complete